MVIVAIEITFIDLFIENDLGSKPVFLIWLEKTSIITYFLVQIATNTFSFTLWNFSFIHFFLLYYNTSLIIPGVPTSNKDDLIV